MVIFNILTTYSKYILLPNLHMFMRFWYGKVHIRKWKPVHRYTAKIHVFVKCANFLVFNEIMSIFSCLRCQYDIDISIWYRYIVSLINDCNTIQLLPLKEENCNVEAVPGLLLGCSWFGTRWLRDCICLLPVSIYDLVWNAAFSHVSIDNVENHLFL